MRPLFYLIRKNLKNTIKDLCKKPAALILYIFLLLFVIGMIVITFIMPVQSMNKGSVDVFSAIVTAALFAAFYLGLDNGMERGSSFFRLSDVNFVFTAPIPPKKVLVYGFINQLFISLLVVIFVSFQIPNLKNNFAIRNYGVMVIYLGIFILFFAIQLGGILLYSLASRSSSIRKWFKRALTAVLVLVLGGFVIKLFEIRDLLKAAIGYLSSSFFDYVPFVGWFRVVLLSSVKGIDTYFWLNLSFILAGVLIMIYILYKVNTDYYEDVLEATEKKEELLRAFREGRSRTGYENSKLRRIKQGITGHGPRAIFSRQLLEYRKTGFFFFNRNTLFIVLFGIASRFLFPGANIKTVLYFSVYMLFFFAIQGKWTQELGKPYIYLMPASSQAKVFYATLSDNLKNLVDGAMLFTIAGIMLKTDLLSILLFILAYTSFGAIYVYGDVMSQRFLGAVHSKNLSMLVKMLLILVVVLPGLVISIILDLVFANIPFMSYYSVLVLIVYNSLASGAILIINKGIFDVIEMR